jgi:two-component system NtrC family response regulator
LRARPGDIPQLAEYFLERSTTQHGLSPKMLSEEAIRFLLAYDFPGNVRELQNMVERACVNAGVAVEILSAHDLFGDKTSTLSHNAPINQSLLDLPFKEAVASLERELIRRALQASGDNRTEAARRLGINRRLLYSKLEEHSIGSVPESNDKT